MHCTCDTRNYQQWQTPVSSTGTTACNSLQQKYKQHQHNQQQSQQQQQYNQQLSLQNQHQHHHLQHNQLGAASSCGAINAMTGSVHNNTTAQWPAHYHHTASSTTINQQEPSGDMIP